MARMSSPLLAACLLLAAGCATAPPGLPGAQPARSAPLPEVFSGIPAPVLAGRAVFDLESGDPSLGAAARCVLRALHPSSLEEWRARALASPEGALLRRQVACVLMDRGEPLRAFTAGEIVAACIDDTLKDVPGRRGTLLAAVRLRELGGEAAGPLRAEAAAGGERGEAARRYLALLGLPDRDLPGTRP